MASPPDQELRDLSVALPQPGDVLRVDFRPSAGDISNARDGQTNPSRPLRVVTVRLALYSLRTCLQQRRSTSNNGCRPPGCWRMLTHLPGLEVVHAAHISATDREVLSQANAKPCLVTVMSTVWCRHQEWYQH